MGFVNVRVLPVAVGELKERTYRERYSGLTILSFFSKILAHRYSHAWVGSARPLLVGARHAQERGRGAGRPGQLEADEQLGGASRRGVDLGERELISVGGGPSNEKLTQLKHRAGSARGLLASR